MPLPSGCNPGVLLLLAIAAARLSAQTPGAPALEEETAGGADTVALGAYNVKADRVEDFGFRTTEPLFTFVWLVPKPEAPYITKILPNTAASKAGLEPGDRILKADGKSAAMTLFSASKWEKMMAAKNAEAASGKKSVTWTLLIQPRSTKSKEGAAQDGRRLLEHEPRVVTLTLPTPPPHWGAALWRAPEGRRPSTVAEPGPLAERSRLVLDQGIWTSLDAQFLGVPAPGVVRPAGPTGYEWHFGGYGAAGRHEMSVTQTSGRTEVILEMSSRAAGRWVFRTSPSGALEKAWHFTRKFKGEVSPEEARVGFEHELDLWANRVGKFDPRWPMELKPGYDPNAIFAVLAARDGTAVAPAAPRFAAEFLKLHAATEAQQTLFADAYGKLGADADGWAYTETSHGLPDSHATVVRVDPSKSEAERCVLLSIDGKPPTAAQVQQWRDDGGDTPKVLGDLPPLASLVDVKDLRVASEESASVLFELPLRAQNGDFPAEKFQARFRVNRTTRAFEELTVQLRDAFRVGGVVKITAAGLQARFQTLDPALPPQPILLKGGGAARIVFVKLSRGFETTRADFKRVVPFGERETAGR